MISLTINGQQVEVEDGSTVLQAAAKLGITIPTLCYHKDLSPYGGCRLCVVEVRGARLPMTSCNLPVIPDMRVTTESPALTDYRQTILRMMLSNYYDAGYTRNDGKFDQDNELAHWAEVYGVDISAAMAKKPHFPIDSDPNPFVWVDKNKCIQCTRCVRACSEIQGRFVWSQSYRGYQARIVAGVDSTMLASRCESCGACVVYCPTGALDNKLSVKEGRADRLVQTTCTYCGVGCQLDLNVKDDVPGGRIIRVTSHASPDVPTPNGLHLCIKGRYGYEFIHHPKRHTRPLVRQNLLDGGSRSTKPGKLVEVDWDTALDIAAKGLEKARKESGGESIAVLASGRFTNEENYLLNKLARQVLSTNHIDCCAHLYSASVVEGLLDSTGLPAMVNSFEEIASKAGSLFVIGSNLTEQHPVFGARIRQAIMRRKIKMVVANPEFINLAEYATLFLNHLPRTETTLLNGLMHIILEKGWQDQESLKRFPQGFPKVKALVAEYSPQRVSEITGVKIEELYQAAEILAQNQPASVIWGTGLADPLAASQNIHALVNLQILLGNLDKPGGGLNPLRTQNNTQGACDLGCQPEMLPGYQPVSEASARQAFEQAWGAALPDWKGLHALDMLDAAQSGKIKALYIAGEDILSASPQGGSVRRSLEACEFVVLQEIMASETTRYADVVLPGVSFAEKTGTFTSAERRIQMVEQAIAPFGEARADWQIISDLARRIIRESGRKTNKAPYSGWKYAAPEYIMQEIADLAPLYQSVVYSNLRQTEPFRWSAPELHPERVHWMPAGQAALSE